MGNEPTPSKTLGFGHRQLRKALEKAQKIPCPCASLQGRGLAAPGHPLLQPPPITDPTGPGRAEQQHPTRSLTGKLRAGAGSRARRHLWPGVDGGQRHGRSLPSWHCQTQRLLLSPPWSKSELRDLQQPWFLWLQSQLKPHTRRRAPAVTSPASRSALPLAAPAPESCFPTTATAFQMLK